MNKIRTKKDAGELVRKMGQNPDIQIILWDEMDSNRIMSAVEDPEMMGIWYKMTFEDTVNGTVTRQGGYFSEAREAIWQNRKNVNRLNDLANI